MRTFPVDTAAVTAVAVSEAVPDTDMDGKPKANRDGEPLFVVQVVTTFDGTVSLIKVKVAGRAPKVTVGASVELVGLVGLLWAMAGRHGIAWTAQDIRVRPAAPTPAAAPTPSKN
ncbi:hypothetical protein [Frankia sp. AgKG'84/4]|uniref:hypothetical protein n=1 Tax=Frankia sp. AgKG'84/4 TaxID=573490 RepID=UPI00200E31E6|nr:hypothetical protein [Frankia sp. AgKG'84/4]MCL9795057.1 hypothetical protein [Frankia sp. AgKG'84/4]